MTSHGYYVGVDGCQKGWVSVALQGSQPPRLAVSEDVASLWQVHHDADAIFIDMPIGLLDYGPDERTCERDARRLLGPRRSSVFPVPCRGAVHASSDDEAKAVNRERTGRGLSVQTLAIRAKIRQVDQLLRSDARARDVFREIHPELLFCGMNDGAPMIHRKKRSQGRLERRTLLADVVGSDVLHEVLAQGRAYLRRELGEDDTLDALAAAVVANHAAELVRVPENPPLDSFGLPMQMVYWPRAASSGAR